MGIFKSKVKRVFSLEHLVLEILSSRLISEIKVGTDAEGFYPIFSDNLFISIDYGMLVDKVNNPGKEYGESLIGEKKRLRKHEITDSTYSNTEVNRAISVLKYNNDVVVEMLNDRFCEIKITSKGYYSFLTEVYIEDGINKIIQTKTKEHLLFETFPKKYWWLISLASMFAGALIPGLLKWIQSLV